MTVYGSFDRTGTLIISSPDCHTVIRLKLLPASWTLTSLHLSRPDYRLPKTVTTMHHIKRWDNNRVVRPFNIATIHRLLPGHFKSQVNRVRAPGTIQRSRRRGLSGTCGRGRSHCPSGGKGHYNFLTCLWIS